MSLSLYTFNAVISYCLILYIPIFDLSLLLLLLFLCIMSLDNSITLLTKSTFVGENFVPLPVFNRRNV